MCALTCLMSRLPFRSYAFQALERLRLHSGMASDKGKFCFLQNCARALNNTKYFLTISLTYLLVCLDVLLMIKN